MGNIKKITKKNRIKRDLYLHIRVRPAEKEAIQQAADDAGITISEYVLVAVLNKIKNQQGDL